ncbi:hypothetical protein GGI07_000440 [Coemansia sp. Benny D115]|nr:hypothetical protein GGI07_000440 [Coemansia sp. Benny D115]
MNASTIFSVDDLENNPLLSISIHDTQPDVQSIKENTDQHPWQQIISKEKQGASSSNPKSDKGHIDTDSHTNKAYTNTSDMMDLDGSTEEITTQGLLDGLEELYDQSHKALAPIVSQQLDTSCTSSTQFESEVSGSGAGSQIKDGSEATGDIPSVDSVKELEDMKAEEVERLVGQHGGFRAARVDLSKHKVAMPSQTPVRTEPKSTEPKKETSKAQSSTVENGGTEEKLEELKDMSDEVAFKIIGSFGGFTKPTEAATTSRMCKTPQTKQQTQCDTIVPEPKEDANIGAEMADMDDAEAQVILVQHGGFTRAKPAMPKATPTKTPNLPPPPPPLHTRTPSPSPLRQATAPSPNKASPFPSRQEVLSARRALKNDIKRPPTFVPPRRTEAARRLSLPAHTPSTSTSVAPVTPTLTFKLPGLKRHQPSTAFTPPTKRASIVQPFKSPARTPDQRPAPLPMRVKPPPKLPPVTVRQTAQAVSATASNSATRTAKAKAKSSSADEDCRVRLRDVSSQVATTTSEAAMHGVPADVVKMTATMASDYGLPIGTERWGWAEARQTLLARGCKPEAVGAAWVRNHFRWSIWTAASYARRFPTQWREFWSVEAVLGRLMRRYAREYSGGERSALRQVLEGDAAAQQLMVLAVARIDSTQVPPTVEVTDGWYSVTASVDSVLSAAIKRGLLREGDKLACIGLRLRGVSAGVDPLSEDAREATLTLGANCVRRARWDARLGFQRNGCMYMSLSAVYAQGGAIGPALDIIVMRRYPLVYRETQTDGRVVIRCGREEQRICLELEEKRRERMRELAESQPAGSEEDAERFAALVEAELPARQVRALFRLLVCDYPGHTYRTPESSCGRVASVTFWAPRGLGPEDFPEGKRFLLSGLTVSPQRPAATPQEPSLPLRLNFNASGSAARPMAADNRLVDQSEYRERGALHVDELCHVSACQEVDVVGRVEGVGYPVAGQGLLRLSSPDDGEGRVFANISFDTTTFGSIGPAVGAQMTVRNAICLAPSSVEPSTFLLRAEETAEFVV